MRIKLLIEYQQSNQANVPLETAVAALNLKPVLCKWKKKVIGRWDPQSQEVIAHYGSIDPIHREDVSRVPSDTALALQYLQVMKRKLFLMLFNNLY